MPQCARRALPLKLREAAPARGTAEGVANLRMLTSLRELARRAKTARTVIVVDDEGTAPPRQYRLRMDRLILGWLGVTILSALLLLALVLATPLRTLIFGPDPETLREQAELTSLRAAALADSLEVQLAYLDVIRATLTGTAGAFALDATPAAPRAHGEPQPGWPDVPAREQSPSWSDHAARGSPGQVFSHAGLATAPADATESFLALLQFPALPPVSGFFARGFDAARGHFGIDIAVDQDTPVRSVGDGYVVFADWTHHGGYTIAVQHAGGFLSVYKHNRRLTKRTGDRVRSRETIAFSGNTGEITTGPHLHFELWRNGLAQDPRHYLLGL